MHTHRRTRRWHRQQGIGKHQQFAYWRGDDALDPVAQLRLTQQGTGDYTAFDQAKPNAVRAYGQGDRTDPDAVRAYGQRNRAIDIARAGRHRQVQGSSAEPVGAGHGREFTFDQVGVADEARLRRLVQVARAADGADAALLHHHDPVRHGQRSLLIVGDVDHRRGGKELAGKCGDFGATRK